jgi:hypothetical protein
MEAGLLFNPISFGAPGQSSAKESLCLTTIALTLDYSARATLASSLGL